MKANTEQVGPTFALVQSLMYASQLATSNQFERLANHYDEFADLSFDDPAIEILIVLESASDCLQKDLEFALELGQQTQQELAPLIRSIQFVETGSIKTSVSFDAIG